MTLRRTLVVDLGGHLGEQVRVCGWVDGLADPDAVDADAVDLDVVDPDGTCPETGRRFVLRDRTGTVPVVVSPRRVTIGEGDPGEAGGLHPEAAVEAVGTVVEADGVGLEVTAEAVEVVGAVLADLPIDAHSPVEARLDWRFLDLRRPPNLLAFVVQTAAERAMRAYWADHGFLELHSPKLRPDPNLRGQELFTLEYFDRQAYLAKSPQHAKQMAMAAGFERVFEIGPVFRANPYLTARHDTEFTSVDVEMSWIESHEEVMAFEEAWLRHVIAAVATEHGDEISKRWETEVVVPEVPFPRITLDDARAIVAKVQPESIQPPGDLDPEGERALGRFVAREHGHQFVFVTEYPARRRAYYHMRTEAGSEHARDFDLLWKGMEVTTGAQREHRYDRLVAQAQAREVPLEANRSYLDCFRFGCPPHGGFGLGLTRFLMALLGTDDVREVTFCPRDATRLRP